MKKLSLLLALLLALSMCSFGASAEGFGESPMLTEQVEAGTLPPVEERLPDEPLIVQEVLADLLDYEIGVYGGTYKTLTTSPNWNAEVFIGNNEALLCMRSTNSDEIVGNVLEGYDVNEDNTVYKLHLRKGLKWSDGTPVTMDDFMFTYNSVILNAELTPLISANMRSGARADGAVMQYEPIDDWTLQITFEESYGGFPVYISIKGWSGYTDMLKPAHFLKQFHIDYAEECHGSLEAYYEFIKPFAASLGYDDPAAEGVWAYVFNAIDMTNWELSDPSDAMTSVQYDFFEGGNFPHLYPYIMVSSESNVITYERNPYYFKIDPDGQQLPYVDKISSRYVEDNQIKVLEAMSGELSIGELDFESYSVLVENSEKGGYNVMPLPGHNTAVNVILNPTYGLNADGTVKDDDVSVMWQDVINDVRFRRALTIALDAEEINDSLFLGFGEINPYYDCSHDIETANELLDEMGMKDVDGDGYRETPSGYQFSSIVWVSSNLTNESVSMGELAVEYWREIGLNITVNQVDGSYYSTARDANEIPMMIDCIHFSRLWHYLDWATDKWGVLWNNWVEAGGLSGTITGTGEYLEPGEAYKTFCNNINRLLAVDPITAVNEVLPEIEQQAADEMYIIMPLASKPNLLIADKNLRNIPDGLMFSVCQSWEFLWFADAE